MKDSADELARYAYESNPQLLEQALTLQQKFFFIQKILAIVVIAFSILYFFFFAFIGAGIFSNEQKQAKKAGISPASLKTIEHAV